MMRPGLRSLLAILALAAVYFCAGKLGLSWAYVHASVSAVWPPTGIALAALLLWGWRLWPGIFLGAFLVNLTTYGSLASTLGIASGNALEALLAAWAINRFANGAKAFERAKTIFHFVLLAPVLSTVVSATFGVASLAVSGFAPADQYLNIWVTWWVGDAVGDLIIAPLLLIWATQPYPQLKLRRVLEAAALLLSLLAIAYLIFLHGLPSQAESMLVLPLLWAAFRFGQRGAVTSVFIISAIALAGTISGAGPFAHADPNQSLVHLQSFMGTMAIAALVLAAAISEARRAEQRLQVQEAISRILAQSPALKEAAPRIVQVLCDRAGWDFGAIWNMNPATRELRCVDTWQRPQLEAPHFEAVTRARSFARGVGLPGRVWSSGAPAWIADVTMDDNFPRAPAARQDDLHGAFGFPIKLGSEVLGVIECLSREVREPDDHFLAMVGDIGGQLGQFIERTQTETLLLESEARLRAVVETAVDGIITIDEQGKILTVNPAAERTFGYSGDEMIGRNVKILMPESYSSEHDSYIRNYLRTGEKKIIGIGREVQGRRKDGVVFPLDLAVSETRVGERRIFTGIVRDITERKRADELLLQAKDELINVNEDLERRVRKRTADLEQANAHLLTTMEEQKKLEEQLRQAQKMEIIGTLAGGIAHDFNNILNIIRGYVTLLSEESLTAQQTRDGLKIIDREVGRGAAVVRQLLTVARKTDSRLAPTHVNDIVLALSELIKETFPKNITVALDLESKLPPVLADSNQLSQALLNVCVNARDAMAAGGKLVIRTELMDADTAGVTGDGKARACIVISDSGIGMDERIRARIFEPFFTTKGIGEGTGLGLAIVYGIVNEHNGSVDVDSAPGRGATFRIRLPIYQAEGQPAIGIAPRDQGLGPRDSHRGTVLVVEDEEAMVQLLKKLLPKAGYRILVAMDGQEAIDLYRAHGTDIDVVMLDLGLPKVTGFEVVQHLKAQNPDVKIIVATGYLEADLKAELIRAGVKDCIHKPYSIEDVVERLKSRIVENQ